MTHQGNCGRLWSERWMTIPRTGSALHWPMGRDGDVNIGATWLIDQPLHLGGGLVAEHRPVSRPADGRP